MNKNLPPESSRFQPKLPSPESIYYKDFHFLDEPLINRKHNKEALERRNLTDQTPLIGLSNQKDLGDRKEASKLRSSLRTSKDSSIVVEEPEEELMRRQIEAIEDIIVEGEKSRTQSKHSSKKVGRAGLSIENPADGSSLVNVKLETPKETNAVTSSRKIFDLSA